MNALEILGAVALLVLFMFAVSFVYGLIDTRRAAGSRDPFDREPQDDDFGGVFPDEIEHPPKRSTWVRE